ncbi:hypothetical protein OROGR_028472 [Orobanche gracilis]
MWFLDLLLNDINRIDRNKWVFISDQQKGTGLITEPVSDAETSNAAQRGRGRGR